MSKIEDALRRLSPEQRALLERRLKQKQQDAPAQNKSIGLRPDTSVFPLSAGQRRLLALEQLFPNTPQFNITVAYRLIGPLDAVALQYGVRRVLERHEVLRGRFNLLNGAWLQQLSDVPDDCLALIDVSHLPATQRLQRAVGQVKKDLNTPFDLATGPLLRAGLFKLSANDHLFYFTVHHIASDAWSVNLIVQEIASIYQSKLGGSVPVLEELPIQYADFAHWQLHWLQTEDAEKQLGFWEDAFETTPQALKLPYDTNPRSVQSVAGASQIVLLSYELTEALKNLSLNEKLTPFTLFLTAFNALLYRYSRQKDLVVCAPIAGRHRVEIEPLIGYFNNLIAIRSSLSGELTYRSLADRIAGASMAASDHQDIPFEVVADLPNLRSTPLTKAFFTFQDALSHPLVLPGIESEPIQLETAGADFDISIFVEQKDDELAVVAEYKKSLFKEETIAALLANYLDVLGAVVRDPHIRLDELPDFMPEEEPEVLEVPDEEVAIPVENISIHANGAGSSGDELPPHVEPVSTSQPLVAPEDDLEQILTRIWQRALGLEQIGLHDNFFEIGGHSLMAVNVFNEIQKYVGDFDLPLAALLESPTIASLAHRIRYSDEIDWSPLVVIQAGRGKLPLFCIHGAGGNVLLYRDLAIQLGPDQTVYGLQSQGMDGDRPILGRIEDMAALYVQAIRKVRPQGPYLLLGYCMGGVVALEIARRLRQQGQEVALLAMLESYNWANAPKETRLMKWKYMYEKIVFHIRNYFLLSGYERKLFRAEKVAELKRRRKVWKGKLMTWLRPKKLIEAQHEGPNFRALAEVWRANDEAVFHYHPEKYPGRVTNYLPRQEYSYHKQEGLNWEGLAHKVERHILSVYPGGMLIQPFVKELAQSLRAEIFRISTTLTETPRAESPRNGRIDRSETSVKK